MTALVLSCRQAGEILLPDAKPTTQRRHVYDLVRSNKLRLVDPDQNIGRWTIATVELERYVTATTPAASRLADLLTDAIAHRSPAAASTESEKS